MDICRYFAFSMNVEFFFSQKAHKASLFLYSLTASQKKPKTKQTHQTLFTLYIYHTLKEQLSQNEMVIFQFPPNVVHQLTHLECSLYFSLI